MSRQQLLSDAPTFLFNFPRTSAVSLCTNFVSLRRNVSNVIDDWFSWLPESDTSESIDSPLDSFGDLPPSFGDSLCEEEVLTDRDVSEPELAAANWVSWLIEVRPDQDGTRFMETNSELVVISSSVVEKRTFCWESVKWETKSGY